jgi:hydroxyacylglutathione hydrolase
LSVLQSPAIQRLQDFADKNKETQGQFTIGDEKVSCSSHVSPVRILILVIEAQRLHDGKRERLSPYRYIYLLANPPKDPEIQGVTGKTDPAEVMAKLREMKNNFK